MKKIILASFAFFAIAISANAQTALEKPLMIVSKEQKALAKAAKEEQLNQAFAQSGCSPEQITQAKATITELDQKSRDLNAASLTDEEKAAKKKELSTERKTKLVAIMGADKYKVWMDSRKKLATATAAN